MSAKDFGRIPVTVIEIDQPRCALSYGYRECRAVNGDAGTREIGPQADISQNCFNTIGTCQDLERIRTEKEPYRVDVSGIPSGGINWNVFDRTYEGWITFDVFANQTQNAGAGGFTILNWGPFTLALRAVVVDAFGTEKNQFYVTLSGTEIYASEATEFSFLRHPRRVVAVNVSTGDIIAQEFGVNRTEYKKVVSSFTAPGSVTVTTASIPEPSASALQQTLTDLKVYNELRLITIPEVLKRALIPSPGAIFHAPFTQFDQIESKDIVSGNNPNIQFPQYPFLDAYDAPPLRLTFTRNDQAGVAETLRATPSLMSASQQPARINPGGVNEDSGSLGARGTLQLQFKDHPDGDYLTDPYRGTRAYDPHERGTFWGKWGARNEYRQGAPVRYVSGYLDDNGSFSESQRYNYILDKLDGPDVRGNVSIKCFDLLKALDAKNAVFPATSPGKLAAAIGTGATSFTLDPVGIGSEYPASFRCRIGGEGFDVSRSGDTCSISQRGLYGGLESHDADDVVQVVAQLSDQIHNVAYEIITGALPSLVANINKEKWDALAADFLPRIYTADITEPTGVEDLIAELSLSAPIFFFADVRTNLIEMDVIREPAGFGVELTEDQHFIAGSLSKKEMPRERIDEVWIYYSIRNAAEEPDNEGNFSRRFILVNPEEQERRGRRAIKRVFTRWVVGVDAAQELAQSYISRFNIAPVRISFDLDAKDAEIWLGDIVKPRTRIIQDITGGDRILNYQVLEAEEKEQGSVYRYMAQSYEFFQPDLVDQITITIIPENTVDGTGAVDQIDLRQLYDATVATQISDITFVIGSGPGEDGGTVVGASPTQNISLINPNNWPWNPSIEVRVEEGGVIAGRGGKGGEIFTASSGGPGSPGQTGFQVRYATTITNFGIIGGGGGGGGGGAGYSDGGDEGPGGGGGGGAGRVAGEGGAKSTPLRAGEDGAVLTGGDGNSESFFGPSSSRFVGPGGDGGDLGLRGQDGGLSYTGQFSGGGGGAAGPAIDGISYVTYTFRGDIRGSEIN